MGSQRQEAQPSLGDNSMSLIFGDVKSAIARILSANTTDPIVAEYTSRAQERLLHKGKWVGTYGRYRVCVNDACLTWPREIETIEAAAVCSAPVDVRNGWYEFLGTGPGVQDGDCGCAGGFIDRGDAIAFDDIKGTGKKLALYADNAADVGAQVLIRYYDSNGNKFFTTDASGRPIEGEYLTLVAPPLYVYSTNEVMAGGFYGVIKPVTKRMVRAYQYTVATLAYKPLAYYEPDETNPRYRRSLVPGLGDYCTTEDDSECANTTIDIVGKFRARTVRKDSDNLVIESLEALRLMVQAIRKSEDNLFEDAVRYEAMAISVLDSQLKHWLGDGAVVPIRIVGAESWGGSIPNLV